MRPERAVMKKAIERRQCVCNNYVFFFIFINQLLRQQNQGAVCIHVGKALLVKSNKVVIYFRLQLNHHNSIVKQQQQTLVLCMVDRK